MKTRMLIMLISLAILFGLIFGYKALGNYERKKAMSAQSAVVTISAMQAKYAMWQPELKAVGSLRAIHGVNVTTELAGMVQAINFTPGTMVNAGTVLVQLNADPDIAQLHSLQANAALADTTYNRDKKQYAIHAISKATLDTDEANLKNLQAQVAEQAAVVDKKTIRAPFTGRLGISAVNLGQYINPGDTIVTLQTLDPMYVDFYVPQQSLPQLSINLPVTVTSDAYPGVSFTGKITTIEPLVDASTRNVEVEATIDNPKEQLKPGMFATVEITTGAPQQYLTLPQTAISFNPYGEIVYVITPKGKDKQGHPILIANQKFVTTGETRGDQITVLQGLHEGDMVVTSGQLKLKNGSVVAINNTVVPADNPAPELTNE